MRSMMRPLVQSSCSPITEEFQLSVNFTRWKSVSGDVMKIFVFPKTASLMRPCSVRMVLTASSSDVRMLGQVFLLSIL